MPERERTERHLGLSDADERVVELDEPDEVAPPTDETDVEPARVVESDELPE